MRLRGAAGLVAVAVIVAMHVGGFGGVAAQQGRGGAGNAALFPLLDANKDGVLTREELGAGLDAWYTKWDSAGTNGVAMEQVLRGISDVVPPPPPTAPPPQNQTPAPEHVAAMIAALPATAPVAPAKPRKVKVERFERRGRSRGRRERTVPERAQARLGRSTQLHAAKPRLCSCA